MNNYNLVGSMVHPQSQDIILSIILTNLGWKHIIRLTSIVRFHFCTVQQPLQGQKLNAPSIWRRPRTSAKAAGRKMSTAFKCQASSSELIACDMVSAYLSDLIRIDLFQGGNEGIPILPLLAVRSVELDHFDGLALFLHFYIPG